MSPDPWAETETRFDAGLRHGTVTMPSNKYSAVVSSSKEPCETEFSSGLMNDYNDVILIGSRDDQHSFVLASAALSLAPLSLEHVRQGPICCASNTEDDIVRHKGTARLQSGQRQLDDQHGYGVVPARG
ncbi:hypothetical protein DPEC_G00052290 [Dallia pectoralis]|uniref:Uncharacterized protein n=1 Tax=Dallia pectoralis TaxID=75939 RepID=A0ACC2HBI1_DALPE|nr:hypothetical protein DPEC_G00052290 [Dallia pectoralis]